MEKLLTLLKETAVFMLAAQMVLHFLPEKKYGKYGKMIVSLIVLSQLSLPVLSLAKNGLENSFYERLGQLEEENKMFSQKMEDMGQTSDDIVENGLFWSVEEKIGKEAKKAGVRVVNVSLTDGTLTIEVRADREEKGTVREGPVSVEKIEVTAQEMPDMKAGTENDAGHRKIKRPDLEEAFAAALALNRQEVEVIELG